MSDAATSPMKPDGRRARRERGRAAVIDAVLDLLAEGEIPPAAAAIAARAGVSVASVFRYFDSLDELRAEAVNRYFERNAKRFEIPLVGTGSLEQRIATFVDARIDQHERTQPVASYVRTRTADSPALETGMHRLRATQTDQLRLHFADEFDRLHPPVREDTVATIATMTSFEVWCQFTDDHDCSAAQIRRAWSFTIERLLSP